MSHPTERRGVMPVYDTINWEGVKISAHPVGWRGLLQSVPILREVLQKAPLFSGSRQVFCVHVKDSKKRNDTITIEWFYHGPSTGASPVHETVSNQLDQKIKFHVSTVKMMESGEGGIRLYEVSLSTGETMPYRDLIGFDVRSTDSLMVVVYGIVLTGLVGIFAALFGAWAGSRIFQADEPIRVVIIEEPPMPPSEPTDGSQ
ncbi:MAG: hypothetical protein IH872_08050 [Chloroflexi bacterium]|nr:hypothetical protein [Chloroflexota bacterium]